MVGYGVQLATDNILYPFFNAFFGKVQRRVHIAVVGDGAGVDIVFNEMVYKVVYFRRPVQQTVFRM
jgi:hypothetical protein